MLRARCSICKASISFRYPLVEFLTGVISVGVYLHFGISQEFFIYFIFCAALVVISFIDLDHKIIPDQISLPGIILGFCASLLPGGVSPLDSVIGILAGGGVLYIVTWLYYVLTGRIGMGGGDIKLLAMIGAFLGWQLLPVIILVSALTGTVIGLFMMAVARGGRYYQIPFGPFLSFGAVVALFWGSTLMTWYLHLLAG